PQYGALPPATAASGNLLRFSMYSHPGHRELRSFPTRRSSDLRRAAALQCRCSGPSPSRRGALVGFGRSISVSPSKSVGTQSCPRSEEHTSELQSRENLVCRLLPEKKKEHRARR